MFKWINRILNRPDPLDEIREQMVNLQKIAGEMDQIKQEKAETVEQLEAAKRELEVFREKDEIEQNRKNSKEPWVEIRGVDHSDVKGIRIELDWNEAFIEHLKDSGIQGKDDDEIVQKWIAMMYQHLVEKFEEKVIENKEQRGTVRDFM